MNKTSQHLHDPCPVCRMEVVSEVGRFDYRGMTFGFCSRQCFDRFVAKPGLYIGQTGMPAPKQRGVCSIKRRQLKLEPRLSKKEAQQLIASLEEMMGIREVRIEEGKLYIVYDLMEATYEQIETALEQCGIKLGSGWGTRLKQSFIHFMEETELDALESDQSDHGCHHH